MYHHKNKWILYILFFLFIISNTNAGDLNITEPINGEYYTVGLLNLNLEVAGTDYTWCYYYFNYSTRPRNITCNDLDTKISVPKDGLTNLTVIYNKSDGQIFDSVLFNVDRDLSTGKGFILFGMILFPILIVFLLTWVGNKLDNEQKPLKYFLYLSSLTFIFVSYYVNMYIIENYVRSDALMDAMNTRVYGWIFVIIIFYFMVYWTYKILVYMNQRKQDRLNY